MSREKLTLKSLADIPKASFQPPAPQWVAWEPRELKNRLLNDSTETWRKWLDARCQDLVREKVNMDRIKIYINGNRTEVHVDGVRRFEFKLKIFMEGN